MRDFMLISVRSMTLSRKGATRGNYVSDCFLLSTYKTDFQSATKLGVLSSSRRKKASNPQPSQSEGKNL